MIRLANFAGFALTLASCSPAPRSSGYFADHAVEAARVVAACRADRHRGEECLNAQSGLAEHEAGERLKLYRKAF